MRVIGIGQCSWDYLAVVPSFPEPDTKLEVEEWHEQGGGPVATALVTLARLGAPCEFLGVTGDDTEADRIRESLIAEGIGIRGIITRSNASSQTAFIAIEKETGSRTIFWRRPSGPPLLPGELPPDFLDGCNFLLLDGLMPDVSIFAARQAMERGIPIMLDAGRVRPGMLEIAELCDYLVAAEQFALDLGWDGRPEAFLSTAKELKAPVVTITLGKRGSVTFRDGEIITVPAFPVNAVDTTGAGDVFHGGYLFGILRGSSLSDTIRFASAVAALKCTRIGGRTGIPSLAATLDFLERNGFPIRPMTMPDPVVASIQDR
ncbi:MAG: sugar kinase [Geobacteraceae bacterium]|nr:sugar kinase [Geobacteraceae bacterium]